MTRRLSAALVVAVLSAGCFDMFNLSNLLNPSPSIGMLGGRWESLTPNSTALLNSCTNFSWNATEQTSSTVVAAGTFSATCFGSLQVTGSARATQGGDTINWTANAVATGAGITNCAVTLTGTATLSGEQLSLVYAGDTCQGAVSGTEVLKLRT